MQDCDMQDCDVFKCAMYVRERSRTISRLTHQRASSFDQSMRTSSSAFSMATTGPRQQTARLHSHHSRSSTSSGSMLRATCS